MKLASTSRRTGRLHNIMAMFMPKHRNDALAMAKIKESFEDWFCSENGWDNLLQKKSNFQRFPAS